MKNKVWNQKKTRILSWILAAVMLLTSVPVSAAAFDASDLFSSGESVEASESLSDPVEVFSDGDPEEAGEIPEVTEAQETADPEVTLFGEEDTDTKSLIHIGDPVTIRFADNKGNSYYDDLQIETKMGESVVIPGVPGYEDAEGSGWKLDVEAPDDGILITSDVPLNLSLDDDIDEYIVDGVLTLYAVEGKEMCTVTFYNNSGTAVYNGGQMKVAKGTAITLPDFPSTKYVNFGWTLTKGTTAVQYAIGESYTVTRNTSFYVVRYAAERVMSVTFLNPNGSTNGAMNALNTSVVKNKKLKLPSVPVVNGYANLGWALTKNASKANYIPGQYIKITKNLKLYAVRKKLPTYAVTFNNNSGTSTSKTYSKLNQKVAKNTYIILPELPKAEGYQNIGWTTTLKGSKPLYKAGSRIKITKNTKFYTVRKKSKYFTVSFYMGNGSTDSAYKVLRKKVEEDTMITLPDIPEREGYLNLGWATSKNASMPGMREGQKYNVIKNTSFYAVQKKSVSLVLHYNDGKVYKTIPVSQGSSFKLPSVANKAGYTFMGWSDSPNQTVSPKYDVGDMITVNQPMDLYAVVFNRTLEPNIDSSTLAQPDLRKYKQVIFVGDSRTNRMALTLNNQFNSYLTQGVTFISKEGEGYTWLKTSGYSALMDAVGEGSTSIFDKPTAVIFNLGVNDLGNVANYISYMNSLAVELKAKGCELFYMSVNPLNSKMIAASSHANRSEADLRKFNNSIRSSLCTESKYTYIDTYGMLMSSGYGTDAGKGVDVNLDDGLHFTTKTYKRIYNYCINSINRYGIR